MRVENVYLWFGLSEPYVVCQAAAGNCVDGCGLSRVLNRPGFDGGGDDTEGSLSWDSRKYPDELRERAMRMALEALADPARAKGGSSLLMWCRGLRGVWWLAGQSGGVG